MAINDIAESPGYRWLFRFHTSRLFKGNMLNII